MIVLDASAAVDLLLARAGADITFGAITEARSLHAPHLLDTEVLHTLRRWAARGWLDPERAEIAIGDLNELPLVRHAHQPLGARVWQLRKQLTAYDATYVALAEALDGTLITADGRLARATEGLIVTIDASA